MPMEGEVRGAKGDEAAHDWSYAVRAARHVPRPKLEVAAIGLVPVPVEEEEHVHTAVKLKPNVSIEIRVDVKAAVIGREMQTRATKVRVWDECTDAGEPFEERQESGGLEHGKDEPCSRSERLFFVNGRLTWRMQIMLEALRGMRVARCILLGVLGSNGLHHRRRKEVIDHDVRERRRTPVAFTPLAGNLLQTF